MSCDMKGYKPIAGVEAAVQAGVLEVTWPGERGEALRAEFAELVWSDGSAVHRQIIPATEMQAFGRHTFRIPFDATGKKWVRFAVWDAAGNGAFTQPVRLK